ncbi:hypothetical protein [Tautonia rosea]|uniref:hypothetical protein n=1 Tax=Tautonia rosea TaxID=2728037 RepID=UPI001476244A|nr:hypothetical protein [Tautonia rosea]
MSEHSKRSVGWMLALAIGLIGCGGGDGGIDEGIDFGDSPTPVVDPSEPGPDPMIEAESIEEETVEEEPADAEAPVAIAPPLDSPAPEPESP